MIREQLRFYRDHEDAPRALGLDPGSRVLAHFLESDIQDDATLCRELLSRIARLDAPDSPPVEFIGNSFAATFSPEGAQLGGHSEGNEHSARLDTRQVERAMAEWLAFISQ